MSQPRLFDDLKGLAGKSLVYGLGSILLKAILFLLIPVYTRYLTAEDYGILALTSSVSAVLVILFALELRAAINYFYYKADSEAGRRADMGTIWIAMTFVSLVMAVVFDLFGRPIFGFLFKSIPFSPYFRLAIWTTFFTISGQFPQLLFQIKEKPIPYVVLLLTGALLNIGLVLYFIIYLRLGVYGYLLGTLLSAALMAIPYTILSLREIDFSIRWKVLASVLGYSFPLIPHSLSAWLLELSDRILLEKFVPLSQIGVYSLGYQLGTIVNMAASAMNTAWVPFVFRILEQDPEHSKERVSRLSTYFMLALSLVFLVVSLFAREAILLAVAPEFHDAYLVTYWVAVAQLVLGLYYVPTNFLFLKNKTRYIPLITLSSAAVDVGANLLLLPRYGMIAAAWAGLASKLVMAALAILLSRRVFPIEYEYGRLLKILLSVLGLFVVGLFFSRFSLWVALTLKASLLLSFPVWLYALGFFTRQEKQFAQAAVSRLLAKQSS